MTISFLKLNKHFLSLLIISFLFPIIPFLNGIRFDQIILYSILIIDFFYVILYPSYFKFYSNKIIIPFLLLIILSISLFSTIFNYHKFSTENIAPLENLINPFAICFILYLFISYINTKPIDTKYVINISIYFIIFNSLFSLFSIFYDVSELMRLYFINDDGNSVWHRSYSLSRYIGFFSQPVEAGFGYSACYLLFIRDFDSSSKKKYKILHLIIIVGGLISTSKIFYITLFLVSFFRFFNHKKYLIVFFICLITPFVYQYFHLALLYFLATRYIETTNFVDDFMFIFNNNFLFGLGLKSTVNDNPLDNAYLQIFLLSGIIGIIIYLFTLNKLIPKNSVNKKNNTLNLIYFILIFIGGFGSPVITLNKANIFIILFSFINFRYQLTKETNFIKSENVNKRVEF